MFFKRCIEVEAKMYESCIFALIYLRKVQSSASLT